MSQTWFQNRSQIFVLGTRSDHFESEKRPLSLLFLTPKKSLPVPETKKGFSRFFSFYIGLFLILCTWENSSFAKEEGLHHKMYNIKLFHCCDVVPNLRLIHFNLNLRMYYNGLQKGGGISPHFEAFPNNVQEIWLPGSPHTRFPETTVACGRLPFLEVLTQQSFSAGE